MCKLFIETAWFEGLGEEIVGGMEGKNKQELRNDMSEKPFRLNHRIPLPGWKNTKPGLALLL